jgi:hypothetical protein
LVQKKKWQKALLQKFWCPIPAQKDEDHVTLRIFTSKYSYCLAGRGRFAGCSPHEDQKHTLEAMGRKREKGRG